MKRLYYLTLIVLLTWISVLVGVRWKEPRSVTYYDYTVDVAPGGSS